MEKLDDVERFFKKVQWKALDSKVIVVAIEGYAGDWAVYIGAVAGNKHAEEWKGVMNHGSKLGEDVARVLFPALKKLKYRG